MKQVRNSGTFKKGHKINVGKHWKVSEKGRENMSKAHLGQKAWNKGKKLPYIPHPKKIGKPTWNKGRHWTPEERKNIADSLPKRFGEKSANWKGGITPINQKIRGSLEYKLWEDSILSRDGFICKECEENRISKLMAHHILNFSKYPELRFAIDNGITFCRESHKLFHHLYGYKNNTKEQLEEFLKQ